MQVLILPWECVTQLTRTPGCDNVAVVYAGRIIEYADKRELFKDPKHPYTHGLFGSLPSMTKGEKRLKPIAGSPPDHTELPEGCVFAPRCIGQGAVRALAEGGMNVVMVTHNPDSAAEIIRELEDCPGKVTAMSNENGDGAVLGEIEKQFGSIDVVINTIGSLDKVEPISEITSEKLNDKLNHQITLPFMMMQSAIPYLKKSLAPRIIFVSTAGAVDGFEGENMADSIARGGILSATYAMARSLAFEKITVNCIARSGMINDHDPHSEKDFDVTSVEKMIPVGHIGTAEEFGALVSYIASEEAGFVTGHVFNLTGGIYIG